METKQRVDKDGMLSGAPRLAIAVAVIVGLTAGILGRGLVPDLGIPAPGTLFRWLLALLPGGIIVSQLVYLWSSRRNQYREALGPMDEGEVRRLADLYFGLAPLAFRYVVPAIFVTILCGTIIGALVNPHPSLPWLYGESSALTETTKGDKQNSASGQSASRDTSTTPAGAPGASGPPGASGASGATGASGASGPAETANGGKPNNTSGKGAPGASPAPQGSTGGSGPIETTNAGGQAGPSANARFWPEEGPTRQALRGGALGFLGAYVYLLLMLTDRARQHDITTGIATWAAAMPVLGLIMGGVTALIIASALGANDTSWTRDAIFFVAGMLPRQFAGFVQSGVIKMFQPDSAPVFHTVPLMTLRGIGPDVASRLEEEGIHDVSALAYASPHQLIRATTYSPRQIVDWIDEALLVATIPEHWDPLEKAGVTGALDLAWYSDHLDAIPALATEIKMDATLLTGIVTRLSQDAQVEDLRRLYWDKTESLKYRFLADFPPEARAALTEEIKTIIGVRSVRVEDDKLTVDIDSSHRDAIDKQLRAKAGIEPES